jgi:DNA-binding FrmR family transcriptional regulator
MLNGDPALFLVDAVAYPYIVWQAMAHTIKEKEKLILRVRRIRGQIEAVERALTNEQDCSDILQLITAARGAMNGLMAELLEDHVRFHVLDPKRKPSSEQALAADELVDIVKAYLK